MLAAKITARAKKDALDDLFKPAMVIVNQVLMEEMTDTPCPSLPKPLNLAKAANYLRQRLRPSDPTDLNFEIDSNHIPEGFMRGDIKVIKEVVNPYFKKKFENFIKTYSIPPKTLIYSIFKIHSYFLKNLKIPPKMAN